MRPRGQTPWMRGSSGPGFGAPSGFNEATGADPVDAAAADPQA